MFATSFLDDESGAVTVDWVVLTAALVGLGLAVMAVVSDGVEDLTGDVNGVLQSDDIISTSFDVARVISDMSTAEIVGPAHDEAHRADMLNRVYPGMSDQQLLDYYEERKSEYDNKLDGYGNAVDHIGYSQQEMTNRGLDIPEGDRSHEDYLAEYKADNGLS